MEKQGDFMASATTHHNATKRRRVCGLDSITFSAALLLVTFVLLWSADIRDLLWSPHKHTCGKNLTVEERAVKILQENPLIG